ncbi:unnamed protein product [Pleuronectes platessa]|uniref:Uncharacterized protein n=1 Tax=Pleuronectes platessa TaxID=8262 RepID=A0A9N7VG89_PLEPL|nr:unnamed protein product [Pleuronectes platessa]
MVCQSPPPTMSPSVNSNLSFQRATVQSPSVFTLGFDYHKPKTRSPSHSLPSQRFPRREPPMGSSPRVYTPSGMEQTAPICRPLQGERRRAFSTRIIIIFIIILTIISTIRPQR